MSAPSDQPASAGLSGQRVARNRARRSSSSAGVARGTKGSGRSGASGMATRYRLRAQREPLADPPRVEGPRVLDPRAQHTDVVGERVVSSEPLRAREPMARKLGVPSLLEDP